jgi:hypothetical protein
MSASKSLRTNTGVRQRPTEHDQQEASPMVDEVSSAKEDIGMVIGMVTAHVGEPHEVTQLPSLRRGSALNAKSKRQKESLDKKFQGTTDRSGFEAGSNFCVVKHCSPWEALKHRRISRFQPSCKHLCPAWEREEGMEWAITLATSRMRRSDSGQADKKAKDYTEELIRDTA